MNYHMRAASTVVAPWHIDSIITAEGNRQILVVTLSPSRALIWQRLLGYRRRLLGLVHTGVVDRLSDDNKGRIELRLRVDNTAPLRAPQCFETILQCLQLSAIEFGHDLA